MRRAGRSAREGDNRRAGGALMFRLDANLRVYLHRERFCCNKEFGYDVRDKMND